MSEATDRWFKVALGLDVTVLITVDVRVNVRVDVRVDVPVDVAVDVDVDVAVDVDVDVRVDVDADVEVTSCHKESPPQDTSQRTPPRTEPKSLQTAVQPLLEAVNTCLLSRTGLPAALVALVENTRLARPKTTDGVKRILLTEVRWMNAKKECSKGLMKVEQCFWIQ